MCFSDFVGVVLRVTICHSLVDLASSRTSALHGDLIKKNKKEEEKEEEEEEEEEKEEEEEGRI